MDNRKASVGPGRLDRMRSWGRAMVCGGVPGQTPSPQEARPSLVLKTPVYVPEVRSTWLELRFLGSSAWSRTPLSSGTGQSEKADLSHQLLVTCPASMSVSCISTDHGPAAPFSRTVFVPCPFRNDWASFGTMSPGPCMVPPCCPTSMLCCHLGGSS